MTGPKPCKALLEQKHEAEERMSELVREWEPEHAESRVSNAEQRTADAEAALGEAERLRDEAERARDEAEDRFDDARERQASIEQEIERLREIQAKSRDVALNAAAGQARTGHNHWVLQRVEQQIRQAATRGELRDWIPRVLEGHAKRALAKWSDAAKQAWDAIDEWFGRS